MLGCKGLTAKCLQRSNLGITCNANGFYLSDVEFFGSGQLFLEILLS